MSHVHEGVVSFARTAQETSKQKYNNAKQTATKYYQDQRQVVEKVSEPYVNKSKEVYASSKQVYETRMRKHVDLAVETARPHVAPLVDKAMQLSLEAWAKAEQIKDIVFKSLVDRFKIICSQAVKSVNNPDHKAAIKQACRKPEEAVTTTLKVTCVFLLLLCRRTIWHIFVSTIRLVVGVIWFFSPLRLFLNLFKTKAPPPPVKKKRVTDAAQ